MTLAWSLPAAEAHLGKEGKWIGKTNKIKDKYDFMFKQCFDLLVKRLVVFWGSGLIISKFWSTVPRSSASPRVLGRE